MKALDIPHGNSTPKDECLTIVLWGGYLIWNVAYIPVFIDSRIDIYEYNGVFADYLDAIGVKNTLGHSGQVRHSVRACIGRTAPSRIC